VSSAELNPCRGQGHSPKQEGILPIAKSMQDSKGDFVSKSAKKELVSQLYTGCEIGKSQIEANYQKRNQNRECSSSEVGKAVQVQPKDVGSEGRLVDSGRIWVEWGFEWLLPGHGMPYSDCGQWRSRGCLNVEGHSQQGLDEEHAGMVFVRRYQRTCFRAECPVCYESWAGKEAGKIAWRLQHAPKQGRPIHLVVSPPVDVWIRSSYESLRRRAYVVAKQSGFRGGSCIFHHLRQNKITQKWYFSPHFHMIGFGWIKGTKEGFESHGWVVKNVGIRKTVSGTALYQLSHAGIHKKYHTVTWFGALAYNNLKVPPKEEVEEVCPICGSPLQPLYYFGSKKIPDERGDFWFSPEGWIVKPSRHSGW